MHIKVPFLAVLIITIFQLALYGIQNNKYSEKDFNEFMSLQEEAITEIQMVDLSGQMRQTNDPEQMKEIFSYFNQFRYKRLMNDQTAFMPNKTMMIRIYAGETVHFIIPYGKEAFIDHRVYRIRHGTIDQDVLQDMFRSLPENN